MLKYWDIGDILDFCGIIHTEKWAKKLEEQVNFLRRLEKDMGIPRYETSFIAIKELKGL